MVDIGKYIVEELSRNHNRDTFSCGVEALDEYLKKDARRQNKENINQTKVLVEKSSKEKDIVGFFGLATTTISPKSLPSGERKKFPYSEVPCIKLTRFAIDKRHQKKGLGKYLLFCALKHALKLSKDVGIYAVIIDAKNDSVKTFYLENGFYTLSDLIVYLPIREIEANLKSLNASRHQKKGSLK